MKESDVQLNATYQVKVANNLVPVTITHEHEDGGWIGVSTRTGKPIRIKNAERLCERIEDTGQNNDASNLTTDSPVPPGEPDTDCENAADAEPVTKARGLLGAAVLILSQDTGTAMGCEEIVKQAIDQDYWTPKAGKTPGKTLYAAIVREIQNKGDQSRFVKVERGKFQLTSQA